MATIKEIAEIVGVSSSAVSRVLNYDEGISVSDEKRESSIPRSKMWHCCILLTTRMNSKMSFTTG